MFWIDGHGTLGRRLKRYVVLIFIGCLSACSAMKKSPEQEAEAIQASAAEQQRKVLEAQYLNAVAQQQSGNVEEAETAYLNMLTENPELLSPRMNLAQMAYQKGESEQAQKWLQEIIERKHNYPAALNLKGLMAREAGQFKEAESFYRAALATDPEHLPAIRNLGILLDLYQGRLNEALALYEQYQQFQADTPDPKVKDWIFDLKRRIGEP